MTHDPKQTVSTLTHGCGSVIAWTWMAPSGTGSLVFIDDVTENRSSRVNSEAYGVLYTSCSDSAECKTADWTVLHGTDGQTDRVC